VRDGLQHALAEISAFVAVAQLERLALPSRRAGWHHRASGHATLERDLDLYRRITTRIEDLAAVHFRDLH
jgi:hypothetical protein